MLDEAEELLLVLCAEAVPVPADPDVVPPTVIVDAPAPAPAPAPLTGADVVAVPPPDAAAD